MELEEVSSLVAGIGSTNVYDLPEGYFVNFSDNVMEKIAELPLLHLRDSTSSVLTAPADYFENFAAQLMRRIEAEEENIAPREELERLSPLLAKLPAKHPYSAPGGYFSELPEEVISGAQAIDFVNQELELEASILHHVERKNVYTVPPGYFFKLPVTILQRVQSLPVKTSVLRTYRKTVSFAAAAIFAGIIFIGTWSYVHRADPSLQGQGIAGIDKIPVSEITSYLDSVPSLPPDAGAISLADPGKDEIKHLLADVSDADLAKYIELHSLSADPMTE